MYRYLIFILSFLILICGCELDSDFKDATISCNDNIQNGNETGVDCGGDCPDCMTVSEMVAFEVQNDSCSIGCDLIFINQSIGYDTYSWDFGDQTTSELENPTHRYSTSGDFDVILTASNSNGSSQVSKKIHISISTYYQLFGSENDDTEYNSIIQDKEDFLVVTGSINSNLLLNKFESFQGNQFWGEPRVLNNNAVGKTILQSEDNYYLVGGSRTENSEFIGTIFIFDQEGSDPGLPETVIEPGLKGVVEDIGFYDNSYTYLGFSDLCSPSNCNHFSYGKLDLQFSMIDNSDSDDGFGDVTEGRAFAHNGFGFMGVGFQDDDIYFNNMNKENLFSDVLNLTGTQRANDIVGDMATNSFIIGGRTSTNNNDMILIRVNANNNIDLNRTYGGQGSEECNAIVAFNSGYLLVGNSNSFGSDLDLFIVHIDQDGEIIWQRSYENPGNDFATDVVLTSDGGIVVAGNNIVNAKSRGIVLKLDHLGILRN